MTCNSLVNLVNSAQACSLYLGDDLNIDLSASFGSALQDDPTTTVTVALFLNGIPVTAYLPQNDLTFGSDFSNGVFFVTIDNIILDALTRTSGYRVMVRLVSNTLQSSYLTLTSINLLSI